MNKTVRGAIKIFFGFGAIVLILYFFAPFSPTDTSLTNETSTVIPTPTPPVIFQAVAIEDLSCYFENYLSANLPQFQIADVVGKDSTGKWVLVRLPFFMDCWVMFDLLDFQGNNPNSLPVISNPSPPDLSLIPTSTPIPTLIVPPTDLPTTDIPPIKLLWKVVSRECNNDGGVNNVVIDLIISGGIPPYRSSPELPINALPEQSIFVTISSNTADGQPSGDIYFTIPRSSDFNCPRVGGGGGGVEPVGGGTNPTNTPGSDRPECSDGKDNDGDGRIDWAQDWQCYGPNDNTEDDT